MAIDSGRIEAAVAEILAAIGEDPSRPGLVDTPRRVAEAYADFFSGVGADPLAVLSDALEGESGELVIVRDIQFRSICEHHLLPFAGRAHIAYLPGEQVVGLGALPKVVDVLAARPQVQERLGEQIADTIAASLDARGVLVVLSAHHECVTMRGGRQPDAATVTIAARGELAEPAARAEIMLLISVGDGAESAADDSRVGGTGG